MFRKSSYNFRSECQKLGNRQLSAPRFIYGVKTDEIKYKKSTATNLRQKKKLVIGSEDGSTSKRSGMPFSNISVYHNDSLEMTGTPETNRPSADDPIMTNVTSGQTTKDHAVKKFPTLDTGAEKARSKDTEMHPFDPIIMARHGNAKVEGMAQDFQASKSYSLIKKSARNMQKSDFPLDLEDKWRVVTVLPVKYPSVYSATSNHVLKDPLDLRNRKETSDIKSLRRNSNDVKNSKASLADEINSLLSTCWKTNNKTEDIRSTLKEDSTKKNSQRRLAENGTPLSKDLFSQKNNGPLLAGKSEFGNISDDNKFQEIFEIFVAETARATILQQKSDCEQCLSKTKSKAEPSRKTQLKKPRLCLYVRQGENELKKEKILGQQSVKTDERTCKTSFSEKNHFDVTSWKPITAHRVSTAQSHRLDNSEASNGTCNKKRNFHLCIRSKNYFEVNINISFTPHLMNCFQVLKR